MKRIVRNRKDARLLPSRYDFALFRIVAWMRLRRTKPAPTSTMYFIDRHQSAAEMWTIGLWLLAATTLYAADLLSFLPLAVALILGAVIACIGGQIIVVAAGLVVPPLWRALFGGTTLPLRINGPFLMLLFFAVTGWVALRPSWARYAAWLTIAMGALNLIAAGLLYLFRDSIARLESSIVGGSPSER